MKDVTLESLSADHFEIVSRWLSNPRINQWLTPEWRGKQINAAIIAMVVRNKKNRLYLVRYTGVPCGIAALEVEPADKTAMIWYFLGDEPLSGRGITSAAVRHLTHIAFEELGLISLYAWAMENNAPSQKVLSRAGFRLVGRIRQSACSSGRQVDRLYFDLVSLDRTLKGAEDFPSLSL